MRNKLLMVTMLLSVISVGPALAEELIHFTNGTVLPIRSHVIEGDMVKIDLGDNGFMAFPKSIVAKIEDAPGVALLPSTGPNKMFKSNPNPSRVYAANPRQSPGNPWAKPITDDSQRFTDRTPTGIPVKAMIPGETGGSAQGLKVIDHQALSDTGSANRRRMGPGTKVTMPNSAIKQRAARRPLTAKK